MKAPSHIKDFVKDASHLFERNADDSHFYYQVRCACGGQLFNWRKTDKPTVSARCCSCGQVIVVYDVSLYLAATPGKGPENAVAVRHPSGEDCLKIFAMYEYGELDSDQTFDENDISWCQIFIEDTAGMRVKILDDETA
jgi:hypothetical protein